MAGFLDRAKEQAQRGISQGKEKVEEVQAQRAGNELLRALGQAYYEQQRSNGSAEAVQGSMVRLEQHIAEHGDAFLKK
ncbi:MULTISPECIES: hypothetical protein [Streptomyces]|uniref:hypothetical protein n=1 Tax=Streptomyces TaxID=1883 RepID=UPI0002EEDE13|nr:MULTISPECIES: hypothetical protein [Streptomyces]